MEIEDVSDELSCWQRFGRGSDPDEGGIGWGGGVDLAAVSSSQGNNHGWRWFTDPRLSCLGYRGIFPADTSRKIRNSISRSY